MMQPMTANTGAASTSTVRGNTNNVNNEMDDKEELMFEKNATGDHGLFFEKILLCLILARILYEDDISTLFMASNYKGLNPIDDIIFKIETEEEMKKIIVWIQAKNFMNPDKNILTIRNVNDSENKDINLRYYFRGYIKMRRKFNSVTNILSKRNKKIDPLFKDEYHDVDNYFIIYTTAKICYDKIKVEVPECLKINKLIKTNDQGVIYKLDCNEKLIADIASEATEFDIVELANTLAKYLIKDNTKYKHIMSEPIIAKYSRFLSENVINVLNIKSKRQITYREGKFTDIFFNSNNIYVTLLREKIKKSEYCKGVDNLEPIIFKLPLNFGNPHLFKKNEKKVNHFVKIFTELIINFNANVITVDNNIVGTDKLLCNSDLRINGGIGSLVGDLLILDTENNYLKFNLNDQTLSDNAKYVLETLRSNPTICHKLNDCRFIFNVMDFPKLYLEPDENDKNFARDYVSKLWFFTNQANGNEIKNMLSSEIGNQLKTIKKCNEPLAHNNQSVGIISLKYRDEVEKWWSQAGETPYLRKSCNFLKEAIAFVSEMTLPSVHFVQSNEIRHANKYISFKESVISRLAIDDFISSIVDKVMFLVSDENILSGLKLRQLFEKEHDCCFISVNYIMKHELFEKVVSELQTTMSDILVIFCRKSYNIEQKIKELFDRCNFKKYIIITDNAMIKPLENCFASLNVVTKYDNRVSLIDVENPQKVFDKNLKFQGLVKTLRDVVGNGIKYVDGTAMLKLINFKDVKIGKKITQDIFIFTKYVVGDELVRNIKIKSQYVKDKEIDDKLLQSFVILRDNDLACSGSCSDIILISNSRKRFDNLCEKQEVSTNIHWFIKEQEEYIWTMSKGSLGKLLPYLELCKYYPISGIEIATFKKHLTHIVDNIVYVQVTDFIPDTLQLMLTHIMIDTQDSFHWIVRIKLYKYFMYIQGLELNKGTAVTFLLNSAKLLEFKTTKLTNHVRMVYDSAMEGDHKLVIENSEKLQGLELLELNVLINAYNDGKMIVACDDFHNFSTEDQKKAIDFLEILNTTKIKHLWVTNLQSEGNFNEMTKNYSR